MNSPHDAVRRVERGHRWRLLRLRASSARSTAVARHDRCPIWCSLAHARVGRPHSAACFCAIHSLWHQTATAEVCNVRARHLVRRRSVFTASVRAGRIPWTPRARRTMCWWDKEVRFFSRGAAAGVDICWYRDRYPCPPAASSGEAARVLFDGSPDYMVLPEPAVVQMAHILGTSARLVAMLRNRHCPQKPQLLHDASLLEPCRARRRWPHADEERTIAAR